MASDRAYLILSQVAESGARPHRPARRPPTTTAARRRSTRGPLATRTTDNLIVLVRRHRPGRHRRGSGPGHYRPARQEAGRLIRRRLVRVPHRARHAAPPPPAVGAALTRYGTGMVVLATLMVSGWFAASGASAVAQMVRP